MSRSFGWTVLTTRPPIEIVPEVMFSSPAISRSKVDFPQPEGPTSTTNCPSSIGTLTPCRISASPNDLRTSRMSTDAMALLPPSRWISKSRRFLRSRLGGPAGIGGSLHQAARVRDPAFLVRSVSADVTAGMGADAAHIHTLSRDHLRPLTPPVQAATVVATGATRCGRQSGCLDAKLGRQARKKPADPQRRLRSQNWFDDPNDPGMTALCLERYLNFGLTRR